jgi:RNA polymerase sigma-70 factor (ECF subfamily)
MAVHVLARIPARPVPGGRPRNGAAPACALAMVNAAASDAGELATLLGAVAQGDRAAFATLFRALAPRVKGFLVRSGASPPEAEELAQETLVLVWRKAASYDPGRASVATWVFTIARNLWIDQVRRAAATPTPESQEPAWLGDLASEPVLGEQRRAHVHAVLTGLPGEQAEAVRMAYFGESTHAQIAARLGIPLGTVKSRIRLAIAALRARLDGLEL